MNRMAIKSRAILSLVIAVVSGLTATAQHKTKDWTAWSDADIEKILKDSPWAKTQIDTNTAEMFYTPTSDPRITRNPPNAGSRLEEGATNQAIQVKYFIRLLSARPVRQALVRQEASRSGKVSDQLLFFANGPSERRIVIAVSFEASDQRLGGKVMQAFSSANTGVLKNSTYLELSNGKRTFLQQYVPPQENVLGAALFIFPRYVDERLLITSDDANFRFYAEYEDKTAVNVNSARQMNTSSAGQTAPFKFKLDAKFKIADMIYKGALEY